MDDTTAGADRFHAGDCVQVLTEVPEGNPRTPHYLRGWTGRVVACHGIIHNPLDHQTPYPPLYSIVFTVPDGRPVHDEVLADIHEEWLTAAGLVDRPDLASR
jgi:hypothetical protein